MQKRLLLCNIADLHTEYKKKMNYTTGSRKPFRFSIFASLRPSHAVTVGAGGTHSVWVCIYHQNVKLEVNAQRNRRRE